MSPFPFPRFEIPKMNGFRANNDSSSTIIIIGGYSLLESSLHPAPVSLWLDIRIFVTKKRRNASKKETTTSREEARARETPK